MGISRSEAKSVRTCALLAYAIYRAREVIRYHRDQRGDDRCWLDDLVLWARIGVERPRKLPGRREMERQCALFFVLRQRPGEPRHPRRGAIRDPARWNDDLARHGYHRRWLAREASRILAGIMRHYVDSLARPLTWRDDERLYALLPEGLWPDTRLGPESQFLRSEGLRRGEQKSCPRYWKSHQGCPASKGCTLTQWGPCGKGSREKRRPRGHGR